MTLGVRNALSLLCGTPCVRKASSSLPVRWSRRSAVGVARGGGRDQGTPQPQMLSDRRGTLNGLHVANSG
jgi:hypothetical protein